MLRRTSRFWIGFLISFLIAAAYLLTPYGSQKVIYTPANKECFSGGNKEGSNPHPWKACVYRAVVGTNGEVAYYLHGRGRDENIWNVDTYYTAQIQKYWEHHHLIPPIVVTISFGGFWLLAPKGEATESGLLEVFLNEIIPQVEKRIGVPKARIITGESMGGLNSLIVGLRAPERFRKIVSICPPIYEMSPFVHWSTIRDFFYRTGADPKTILAVFGLAKKFAINDEEWDRVAPLKLIQVADSTRTPEIYLTSGLYDRYGIFEGAEKFASLAEARHFKIQWRPLYGNHCVLDIASYAEALTTSPVRVTAFQ